MNHKISGYIIPIGVSNSTVSINCGDCVLTIVGDEEIHQIEFTVITQSSYTEIAGWAERLVREAFGSRDVKTYLNINNSGRADTEQRLKFQRAIELEIRTGRRTNGAAWSVATHPGQGD